MTPRTVIQIKLTAEQKAELKRRAHTEQMSVSEYVRSRALKGFVEPTNEPTPESTGEPEMAQAAKIVRDLTAPKKHEPGPVERVFG